VNKLKQIKSLYKNINTGLTEYQKKVIHFNNRYFRYEKLFNKYNININKKHIFSLLLNLDINKRICDKKELVKIVETVLKKGDLID
jgi:hypothetical protein